MAASTLYEFAIGYCAETVEFKTLKLSKSKEECETAFKTMLDFLNDDENEDKMHDGKYVGSLYINSITIDRSTGNSTKETLVEELIM